MSIPMLNETLIYIVFAQILLSLFLFLFCYQVDLLIFDTRNTRILETLTHYTLLYTLPTFTNALTLPRHWFCIKLPFNHSYCAKRMKLSIPCPLLSKHPIYKWLPY